MPKMIDLTGQKFGMLTVVEFTGRRNCHSWFRCECQCGGMTITTSNNLRRGHTISCGCFSIGKLIQRSRTHSLRWHPLYVSWIGMRNRCYYERHNRYKHYGGKGVGVYTLWQDDFIEFYRWGIANGWKKGLSLDRKDNDKDYCPDNCRFSNVPQQNRNRTSNVHLTIDGVTKILVEWSEFANVKYETLRKRLKNGWTPKDAVFGKQL